MDIQFYFNSILVHLAFTGGQIFGIAITIIYLFWVGMLLERMRQDALKISGMVSETDITLNEAFKLSFKRLRKWFLRAAVVGAALIGVNVAAYTFQPRIVISEPNPARQEYLQELDESETKVKPGEFVTPHQRLKAAQPDTKQDLKDAVKDFREETKP